VGHHGGSFDPTDLLTKVNRALTIDEIRAVARTFPTTTSALDGLLCRHIALLPDAALACPSHLPWLSQFFADYAPYMTILVVKLMPKPSEADELLYPIVIRLHLRLLCMHVPCCERTFLSHVPFSNTQQRDALDTAFRHMARVNFADSAAQVSGQPTWARLDVSVDLRKCFETLQRGILWHTGTYHNYPLMALRLSLRSYSWDRRILGV
jgi:hypothetical protein